MAKKTNLIGFSNYEKHLLHARIVKGGLILVGTGLTTLLCGCYGLLNTDRWYLSADDESTANIDVIENTIKDLAEE